MFLKIKVNMELVFNKPLFRPIPSRSSTYSTCTQVTATVTVLQATAHDSLASSFIIDTDVTIYKQDQHNDKHLGPTRKNIDGTASFFNLFAGVLGDDPSNLDCRSWLGSN